MTAENFTILFVVTFVHDYFEREEDSLLGLRIEPDERTKQVLRDNKLLYKIEKNELICLTQTRVDFTGPSQYTVVKDKTLLSINNDHVLRFNVFITDQNFLNYTSLTLFNTHNKIYRFSNKDGNSLVGVNFLSKPVPEYKATQNYEMGSLVSKTGNIFEAIQFHDATNPKPTTDENFWILVPDPVVSQADLEDDKDNSACFAVLEISFSSTLPAAFTVFDNDKIRDDGQKYVVHFRNRSSYWKYVFNTPTKAKDSDGLVKFKPAGAGLSTQSVIPVGLTLKGMKTILKNDTLVPLPSADITILKADPEPPTDKSIIISEIRVAD